MEMTFGGHLEEFRKRLLVSLAAIGAAALFCFFYVDEILGVLIAPIRPQIGQIYFFSPTEAFVIKVKAALLAALVIASPLVVCQLWLFLSPGMYAREKKAAFFVVFLISFLFAAGALFSFAAVLPMALNFLIGQQTEYLRPLVSMSEYLGFLTGMVIAFGFAFNFPVFVTALVAAGVVRVKTLNLYQRHIAVFIFIAAAVLTPGPDIASQLLLAFPLVLLFALGVAGAKVIEIFKNTASSCPETGR